MSAKRIIKQLTAFLLPVGAIAGLNAGLRRLTAATHHLQFIRQWRLSARAPHHFDPFIDLCWKWEKTRNPMSWERGIFGLLAMKPGCRQLDLCCGEGFYTHRFYSGRAGSVIAIDYDQAAIARARRQFKAPNIDYRCADIREEMPQGPFDNITWDAGIEYFTPSEITGILAAIKTRLACGGILSGYCIPDPDAIPGSLEDGRKFAVASPSALVELLRSEFDNVTILRTIHTDQFGKRNNCYFFASDGILPFNENWLDLIKHESRSG
ncbi:MAG TPA: class I SAM-dependent methyltransferase [Rhizomicrobium sp.]|nr:class I SAM-dependent methyltransferase [Rhizomicrobium sp.]